MRLPIFLDTDLGIDDAVAIVAAIFTPELDPQLTITTTGNVSVGETTRSASQLLYFQNVDIPLAQGAAAPLARAPYDAASVHGKLGMAGYDFVEHNRQSPGIPAFLAICDALMRAPEPVALMTIGPLTSIAPLFSQCPECKPYIRRLVIMSGSAGRGNCTLNVELSIIADPEVAVCVFRSGIEIVMCGLDVANQVILTSDYLATLLELNRTGKMLYALFSYYRGGSMQSGLCMHDLCAIAWLVHPELFTPKPCFVVVETQGEFISGMTVVDIDGCLGKPVNVQVVLDLDVKGFQQWVAKVLALAL